MENNNKHMRQILFFSLFFLICRSVNASQIALIIDDMGNKKQDAKAFVLPAQIAFAILPNKRLSTSFSERAAAQDRDVMLHMPMESLSGNQQEEGVLLSNMPPDLIVKKLQTALESVPHAVGLNNHMGSKLTQLSLPMSVTMDFLSKRGLFFVDSRTTRYSKAELIAKKKGVVVVKRNVFLDHSQDPKHIDAQFQRLIRLSKKYGYAVGIAHPHPQTLEYLSSHLELLENKGVALVKLSELLSPEPDYAQVNRTKSKSSALLAQ